MPQCHLVEVPVRKKGRKVVLNCKDRLHTTSLTLDGPRKSVRFQIGSSLVSTAPYEEQRRWAERQLPISIDFLRIRIPPSSQHTSNIGCRDVGVLFFYGVFIDRRVQKKIVNVTTHFARVAIRGLTVFRAGTLLSRFLPAGAGAVAGAGSPRTGILLSGFGVRLDPALLCSGDFARVREGMVFGLSLTVTERLFTGVLGARSSISVLCGRILRMAGVVGDVGDVGVVGASVSSSVTVSALSLVSLRGFLLTTAAVAFFSTRDCRPPRESAMCWIAFPRDWCASFDLWRLYLGEYYLDELGCPSGWV